MKNMMFSRTLGAAALVAGAALFTVSASADALDPATAKKSVTASFEYQGSVTAFVEVSDTRLCTGLLSPFGSPSGIVHRYDFSVRMHEGSSVRKMMACAVITENGTGLWEFFPV